MDAITETESEKIAREMTERVNALVGKAHLDAEVETVVKRMLLSPSLNSVEKHAIESLIKRVIKRNVIVQGFEFSQEETFEVTKYLTATDDAEKLKEANDAASANFSKGSMSGSYQSPGTVIDAQFKVIRQAHTVCAMLAKKIGLIDG